MGRRLKSHGTESWTGHWRERICQTGRKTKTTLKKRIC